jgi:hypothetical protein
MLSEVSLERTALRGSQVLEGVAPLRVLNAFLLNLLGKRQ